MDELKKRPPPVEDVLPTCSDCASFKKTLTENLSGGVSGVQYKCLTNSNCEPWPDKAGCLFHSVLVADFNNSVLGSFNSTFDVPVPNDMEIQSFGHEIARTAQPIIGTKGVMALEHILGHNQYELNCCIQEATQLILATYTANLNTHFANIMAHQKGEIAIYCELVMATMRRELIKTLGVEELDSQRREMLLQLEACTEQAIAKAAADKSRFSDESINWGDLSCVNVETVKSLATNNNEVVEYRVFIEEACPTCGEFRKFIEDELFEQGFTKVEVHTEW